MWVEPVSFSPPRLRLLPLVLTTVFFGLLGLLMAGADGFWRWTGLLLMIIFAAATLVLVARMVRPGPSLVVDAEGIIDRTTLLPTGRVPWREIAALRKREIGRGMGRERLLEVVLLDPDRFRARPRGWARRLADAYRGVIKQPDVTIPGSMVTAPLATVVAEIQRRRPQLDLLELPPPQPGLFARLGRGKAGPPRRRHPDVPQW